MGQGQRGGIGPQWEGGAQAVFLGLREWRAAHPKATLAEIEAEVDQRLAARRGQLLTDVALASAAADLSAEEQAVCPDCGGTLRDEGVRERTLLTTGGARVTLTRDYATGRQCGRRLFPLDVELGLLPNHRVTPRVEELLARLGSTVTFAEAVELLQVVLGLRVSEATLRQRTYSAGIAALAVEAAAQQQAVQAPARVADPPERLQLSLDATKVPLVRGVWTDVKLAVFAELQPGPVDPDGLPTAEAVNLSYVARWEPAEQFGPTITPEAQRRGLDEVGVVVSPNDGGEWIQGNLDLVAPQAVRILDPPHAVEHLGHIGELVYGVDTAEARAWVAVQYQTLREDGPVPVLAELARCRGQGPCATPPACPDDLTPTAYLAREVAYFEKRAAQLDYATFRRLGYPLGSGIVESGHKVVVGQRCKGAGQHWAAHHLNPLLVLRCASCNDRWEEPWTGLWAEQCQQTATTRRRAQQARRPLPPVTPPPVAVPSSAPPAPAPPPPAVTPRPKLVVNGRPTATHPWRSFAFGAALRPGG